MVGDGPMANGGLQGFQAQKIELSRLELEATCTDPIVSLCPVSEYFRYFRYLLCQVAQLSAAPAGGRQKRRNWRTYERIRVKL